MDDTIDPDSDPDELPAAGRRWGAGAGSVLPYLARSLQARPSANPDAREAGHLEPSPAGANRSPRPSKAE
jgi:hypothetical protein